MTAYLPPHTNQYRDPAGKPWPKSFGQDFNGKNCWAAMAVEAADFATRGALKLTPPQVRNESGDRTGGANRGDVARVLRAHGIAAVTPFGVTWAQVKAKLATGRWGVWVATDYDVIPDAKSCSPKFDGLHALFLPPVPPDPMGRMTADDPLCDKSKWYPEGILRAAAEKCRDQAGASGLLVVYVKQPPLPKPVPPLPADPKDAQIVALTTERDALLLQVADLTDLVAAWVAYADAIAAIPRPDAA